MTLRASLSAAMLLWQLAGASAADAPAPEPKYFQYMRPLAAATASGQTCAMLDGSLFAHAASGSLNDLRLYAAESTETPFTLTESGTQHVEEEPAMVRNLGTRGGDIVFDLQMPQRPYTAVNLAVDSKDFFATARVSGSDGRGGAAVDLGTFALFDLSSQHLSRSTTLPLQETTFAELHVSLRFTPSPGSVSNFSNLGTRSFGAEIVKGATVPPSREAQTLYAPVAAVAAFTRRGRESVATLHVPAHVPLERISFTLEPAFHTNFLRAVNITARPDGAQDSTAMETLSGEISRVQLPLEFVRDAAQARVEKLSIDAVLGADLRQGASVELAIENGDDAPLPLMSAQLEMRERQLCFDAASDTSYALMYGDAALKAPQYDYARLFKASPKADAAPLGMERQNPIFVARADTRPYSERHPELLWVALIAAVAALGVVALRSARRHHG